MVGPLRVWLDGEKWAVINSLTQELEITASDVVRACIPDPGIVATYIRFANESQKEGKSKIIIHKSKISLTSQ